MNVRTNAPICLLMTTTVLLLFRGCGSTGSDRTTAHCGLGELGPRQQGAEGINLYDGSNFDVVIIGTWNADDMPVRVECIHRSTPGVLVSHGSSNIVIRDVRTSNIIVSWSGSDAEEITYDPTFGGLRVKEMPPVMLSERALSLLSRNPNMVGKCEPQRIATEVISEILLHYVDEGVDSIIGQSLPDLLAEGAEAYWRTGLPREKVMAGSNGDEMRQLLPNKLSRCRMYQPFAHEVNEILGTNRSKGWEALVTADAIDLADRTVRLSFVVYGDHFDGGLIDRVRLTHVAPVEGAIEAIGPIAWERSQRQRR